MPIHDWTRVRANRFHDFHQGWTIAIRNALNGGLLPGGYSALVEQHAGGLVPDVIALQRRSRPDRPAEPKGGAVVTAMRPKARHVIRRYRRSHETSSTEVGGRSVCPVRADILRA